MSRVKIGNKAPDFFGATDGGGRFSVKDLGRRKLVLYFYPKNGTPGCTTEAQAFRNSIESFRQEGTEVIGVSKDSIKQHDNFKEKHHLPFPLISDVDGKICKAYGVWQTKKNYGREYMGIVRSTFLIDAEGNVARVWENVRVKGHVDEVLAAVRSL